MQWISGCFCYLCRNEWWGWLRSPIHSVSSLLKYKLFFFAQKWYCLRGSNYVLHAWIYKMLIKEKLQQGKVLYWNHAEFWIFIQNITFEQLKKLLLICHIFTSLGSSCAGKRHDIFVTWHNKFYFKCTCDYAEIWQLHSKNRNLQYFSGCKSISMERVAI